MQNKGKIRKEKRIKKERKQESVSFNGVDSKVVTKWRGNQQTLSFKTKQTMP